MTIPASDIVVVNPGVISSGGNSLVLNGVIITQNTLLPTASVVPFASSDAVSAYFGASSDEYALANNYFSGYDNSTVKPNVLYFAPYVATAREAWLKSGSLSGMTLAQLQALGSGTLIVTVDGVTFTSASINLSAVASFSAAATAIAAGFTGVGKPTCAWNAVNSTFVLTSTTTGATSTIGYCTGTLSAGLKFTAALGAVASQGAAVTTPADAMNSVKSITQNWATFMTVFEPVTADKQLFAEWVSAQNQRYMYVAWDTDAQAIVANSATCFGALAKANEYEGVVVVYNTANLAAFTIGMVASIDFQRPNGRITAAFKSQAGLTPTVTDQTNANVLLANGYSFYGSYATANDGFVFFYNGQMSGNWGWIDPYVDQIYFNNQLQLSLMTLLMNAGSIPYTESGYGLIRAALNSPIQEAITFGTIRNGVTLTSAQIAQVNQAAGRDVSTILQQQGYYLQVLNPSGDIRAQRGSPVINLWYTDGGAIQKITLSSIDVL